MSLLGKAFVVTGGASGIGLATVRKLLQLSATVHSIDKSPSKLHASPDTQAGTLWSYPSVDVSSRPQVSQTFRSIVERSPKVDGLVNCAGVASLPVSSIGSDDVYRKIMSVNVDGTWNVTTEFAQLFESRRADPKRSPDVSIVNVGSVASFVGLRLAAYVASKHAVLGLTRSWAQEWGELGIRVNMVAPGVVKTPMAMGDGDELISGTSFPTALKPYGEPEEIADTILFLLGGGSSWITGQSIRVDGGWP